MNKIYLCTLPLALILAAYSSYSVADGLSTKSDPACDVRKSEEPMVSFDLDKMQADPECVSARLGTTIVLRLTSEKALKSAIVKIDPKDSFDDWLNGRNDSFDDVIFISVPGKYDPNMKRGYSTHHYNVEVNGKKIDPRVEVEH